MGTSGHKQKGLIIPLLSRGASHSARSDVLIRALPLASIYIFGGDNEWERPEMSLSVSSHPRAR